MVKEKIVGIQVKEIMLEPGVFFYFILQTLIILTYQADS